MEWLSTKKTAGFVHQRMIEGASESVEGVGFDVEEEAYFAPIRNGSDALQGFLASCSIIQSSDAWASAISLA
jgi:hypothetical protein